MPRITAPVAQLTRSINSAARAGLPRTEVASALSPKYAELLRTRTSTGKSDPVLSSHRPTPAVARSQAAKPLMQFHSSSPQQATPTTTVDAFVLPALHASADSDSLPAAHFSVPILPDNYSHSRDTAAAAEGDASASSPSMPAPGSIVAAHPDQVLPGAPLSGVSGIGLDGIDLGFLSAAEKEAGEAPQEGRMIRDIWRGMVDNVMGSAKPATS